MKVAKDEATKKVEICRRKIFTKNKKNIIISKDYNPFKVNYKIIYKRRDGLFMKGEILSVVKKLSKKYNKKEKIILEMIKKCKELGYNIRESKVLIEEFFEL